MNTQGSQDQASTQPGPARQRSADPLEEMFRLLGQMEPGAAGLDPNISLASIAISMRRIATALEGIHGNLTYTTDRQREQSRDNTGQIVNAIKGMQPSPFVNRHDP